ncbi:MAG: hypothetical protein AAFX87_24205 [Bacteroidota bacterium]
MAKFLLTSSLSLLVWLFVPTQAQNSSQRSVDFGTLKYGTNFPKTLLSTKSVVLVQIKGFDGKGEDWKTYVSEAQSFFKKSGIDAVAYYNLDNVFSGQETTAAFSRELDKRGVKNLIFLVKESPSSTRSSVVITTFNEKATLIDPGQEAWKTESANLKDALNQVYRSTANAGLKKSNYLINDMVEFGALPNIIKSGRFEIFSTDLRIDKLAIPKFENDEAGNEELAKIFEGYPYQYQLTDPSFDVEELKSRGFRFIVYSLQMEGYEIKQLLNYEVNDNETDYVTIRRGTDGSTSGTLVTISVKKPVYKYYIKHLYSNNVFLGDKWDADITWQAALNNHVSNLKEALVKE